MSKAHKIEKPKPLIVIGCSVVYVLTQPYLRVDIDPTESNSTADEARLRKPHLLVLEADDAQWTVVRKALMRTFADAVLVHAASREQLLGLTREWVDFAWEIPKLILLNTHPSTRSENWQLLADLKSLADPLNQIPAIMIICSSMQTDIAKAYQRGCSVCIRQPVTMGEWVECFKELRLYWWETVTLPPMHLGLLY